MEDAAERAARSARELARRIGVDHHDVLVVLGSGLSGVAELLGAEDDWVPLDTLPYFPHYTVSGHRAHGWSFDVDGRRTLVLGGRRHLYEGTSPMEAVHPLRTGIAAGCRTVILTSATGAIRDDLRTGTVAVVGDHLNLTGRSPLIGPDFVDLVGAYSETLRKAALATPDPAAGVLSPQAVVYAQMPGPQFETPAEIRMLRTLGADVVGMSLALETIAARAAGVDVLGLALVTNPAATDLSPMSELAAISAAGAAASPAVAAIVRHVIGSLP
ncbi:MAG TPA: purine-nucleoside phosphorylase [Acidimicrobiales bacterium]|jgi:purine-nucleoside phosphorylase|nr:purine-nucleoside phosphorylase [Acidimicrobiales bacterium]